MSIDNNISFLVQPPQNTRQSSFVNSRSYLIEDLLPNNKRIQRRVSLHANSQPVIKDETRLSSRRHSSAVHKTFKQLNQRETAFTNKFNSLIPDLIMFTDGPGAGKYSQLSTNTHPCFLMPKADRDENRSKNSTPEFYYHPIKEHIPGHYMSKDTYETIKNQRKTSFTSNQIVPDLNIFACGPGAGKYARKESIGKKNLDPTLEANPAFTIPKSSRPVSRSLSEEPRTPGDHYYPKKEKIPGYYSIVLPTGNVTGRGAQVPGPGAHAPEKSKDYLRRTNSFTIPKATRFNNFYF